MTTAQSSIWPNLYIVGAAKCGTTSLFTELQKHPQVFFPEVKEPHFFVSYPPPPGTRVRQAHRAGDRDGYLDLYKDSEGYRAIGDASPSYLWDHNAPGRIHEISPHANIVIILRDPVIRAHSQYLMNHLVGSEPKSVPFFEALRRDRERTPEQKRCWWTSRLYVELGLYCDQVSRYFDLFGRKQVSVVLFEDLIKDPLKVYSGIARQIGIDASPFEAMTLTEAHNPYKTPRLWKAYHFATRRFSKELRDKLLPAQLKSWLRNSPLLYSRKKPPLDEQSQRFLQSVFDPDITRLELLLGRKLPELRKSWI